MAGTTLGTAYVQIAPSTRGISGSISSALGGEAQVAGTSMGSKIAGFATKAFIVAGVGKAMMEAVKAGAALEQSYLGGLDTLYGDAAEAARAYAREAAAAGISMNSYSEQAVSFGASLKQAFGGDAKKAAEAANTAILDMADNSAKMGTDIQSIQMAYQGFAKQNYQMLDNLRLGYGGTKTEMQRLLSDAEKISGVKYDMSNLGDVYSAIHVVQGELGLAGVAAKEASETMTGSFNAMKAGFQNLLGGLAIGENVNGALMQLVKSAGDFLFKNLIPMLGQIIVALPGALVTYVWQGAPMLAEGLITMLNNMSAKIEAFADGLSSEKIASWASKSAPKIFMAMAKLMVKVPEAILSNLGRITIAVGKIGLTIIKGLGSNLWGKVTAGARGILTRFMAPITTLVNRIRSAINKIKGLFRFRISIPRIPLPHFGISPAGWRFGDLLKGSIPKLRINWRAKGGIFDSPELIGAGEAGREILTPEKLLRQITAESSDQTNLILMKILTALNRIADSDTSVELNSREVGRLVRNEMATSERRGRRRELGLI